jgi:thiamine transport system permease protein
MAAMVRASLRIGDHWTVTAWRLRDRAARPGASTGIDPLASLVRSGEFALTATIMSVVLGALAALAIVALRRRGRLLDIGLMLPLATSAVTIGLGVLITFDHAPFDWRSSTWLVPVGHALVAIPFVVRTVLPVLRTVPDGWRDAAATLGASPIRSWWSIDVVTLRRPLVVAAGFAAAISLGEFGATTFLTRSGRETMPIAINRLLGRAGGVPRAQAFVLATILAAATAAVIVELS